MPRAPSPAGLGILVATLFLAAYFAVAATLGFEGPAAAWTAYGEPPCGPPVQQPICFWSNLSFMIVGIAILARIDGSPGPLRGVSSYSLVLGLLTVWMGPASMLEHGTLTTTWGWFDATAIHWFALFTIGYVVLRAIPGAATSRSAAAIFWGVQALAWAGLGIVTWHMGQVRMPASMVLLSLVGVALLAALTLGRRVGLRFHGAAWRWFAAVGLAFALGFVCLQGGAEGGPLAPWGHGVWHVCCAAAMYGVARLLGAEAGE